MASSEAPIASDQEALAKEAAKQQQQGSRSDGDVLKMHSCRRMQQLDIREVVIAWWCLLSLHSYTF